MNDLTSKNYGLYYQANIQRELCWYFAAILRSFEHVCFDRTLDVQESLFEFFVPVDMEDEFLDIMQFFERENVVMNLKKLPNRLIEAEA